MTCLYVDVQVYFIWLGMSSWQKKKITAGIQITEFFPNLSERKKKNKYPYHVNGRRIGMDPSNILDRWVVPLPRNSDHQDYYIHD